MPDNKRVLETSLGMPLFWIYDKQGVPITMDGNTDGKRIEVNQMITKFNYKYDEENDDECCITIQVVRSNQLDNPEFRTDNIIKVRWGYILPGGKLLQSPIRTVAIRDIKSTYKSDGIEMELICSDLVSYLKNQRDNTVSDSDNFIDWINEIIKGKYIYTHTIKGKVRWMNKGTDRKNIGQFITKKNPDGTPQFQKEQLIEKNRAYNDQYKQTDNTQVGDDTHVIFQGKDKDKVIMGKGNALYQEAKRLLNEHPDGPGIIEGRDNKLNILIRDWNQAATAIYTYAGGSGELIDFKPKTNVIKTDDDQIEQTHVNPDTKQVESNKMAHSVIDFNELPDGVTRLEALKVESMYRQAFDYNAQNLLDQINVKDTITFKRTIKTQGFANKANVMGSTRVYTGKQYFDQYASFSTKSILNSPFLEGRRREAIMKNFMMKKVERKFEAQATTIGDPSMVCGKIHLIKGVAKVDSGNWYATTVDHKFDDNGYKCDITYLKKPKLLRRLMEKREYPPTPEGQQTSVPENNIETVVYEDLQPLPSADFTTQNIDERLKAQELFDKQYLQGNDVAFQTRDTDDTANIEPNSMNT